FDSPPTRRRGDRRTDRPQSRRKPRSYQVTLDGLGKAAATKHWQVGRKPTFGNRVSRRQPELSNSNQTPHPYGDIEFGNVPERWAESIVGGSLALALGNSHGRVRFTDRA